MIYRKCSKVSVIHALASQFQVYNSKFEFTAKSLVRGDSNKYTKRMIYRKCSKVSVIHALASQFQVYNSKFEFTAKSLVTNTVVIKRVLCNRIGTKALVL